MGQLEEFLNHLNGLKKHITTLLWYVGAITLIVALVPIGDDGKILLTLIITILFVLYFFHRRLNVIEKRLEIK